MSVRDVYFANTDVFDGFEMLQDMWRVPSKVLRMWNAH